MSKIKVLGAAFFAVLAFGAMSAANASAGEWLLNGAKITTAVHAVTEGTWLLLALGFGGFSVTHVICNGKLLGTVGPGVKDEVTKVESLSGATTVDCEVLHSELGICSGSLLALVKAINLPWATELLLPSGTEIVDHFTSTVAGKEVGFEVECTTGTGGKFKESCEGNVLTKPLSNVTGGVLGEILNALSKSCSGGTGTVGHTYGHGVTTSLSGTLSVS
jgi:hypothetical protein